MVGPSAGQNWEFDEFKLLADKRLLVCDGTPVPLMSKAFDTLVDRWEERRQLSLQRSL